MVDRTYEGHLVEHTAPEFFDHAESSAVCKEYSAIAAKYKAESFTLEERSAELDSFFKALNETLISIDDYKYIIEPTLEKLNKNYQALMAEKLLDAALKDDLDAVKQLLKKGVSPLHPMPADTQYKPRSTEKTYANVLIAYLNMTRQKEEMLLRRQESVQDTTDHTLSFTNKITLDYALFSAAATDHLKNKNVDLARKTLENGVYTALQNFKRYDLDIPDTSDLKKAIINHANAELLLATYANFNYVPEDFSRVFKDPDKELVKTLLLTPPQQGDKDTLPNRYQAVCQKLTDNLITTIRDSKEISESVKKVLIAEITGPLYEASTPSQRLYLILEKVAKTHNALQNSSSFPSFLQKPNASAVALASIVKETAKKMGASDRVVMGNKKITLEEAKPSAFLRDIVSDIKPLMNP